MKNKKIIKVISVAIICIITFIGIKLLNKPTILVNLCDYDYKISFEISKTCEEELTLPKEKLIEL